MHRKKSSCKGSLTGTGACQSFKAFPLPVVLLQRFPRLIPQREHSWSGCHDSSPPAIPAPDGPDGTARAGHQSALPRSRAIGPASALILGDKIILNADAAALEGAAASDEVIGCLQRAHGEEGSGGCCLPNNTALVMYEESSKAGQPLPKERFQTLRGAAAVAERAPSGALRMKLRRTCGVRGCEARRGSCLLMTTAFPRCSRGRARGTGG